MWYVSWVIAFYMLPEGPLFSEAWISFWGEGSWAVAKSFLFISWFSTYLYTDRTIHKGNKTEPYANIHLWEWPTSFSSFWKAVCTDLWNYLCDSQWLKNSMAVLSWGQGVFYPQHSCFSVGLVMACTGIWDLVSWLEHKQLLNWIHLVLGSQPRQSSKCSMVGC